jgi:hypothetical protein
MASVVLAGLGLSLGAAPPGLYVREGVLLKDDASYRGVGTN